MLIAPGLRCRRANLDPDVMRGEETQLLGAFALGAGNGWFVLPGTHSKWVLLQDGAAVRWRTHMTGELFALLGCHGTLAAFDGDADVPEAFEAGLRAAADGALTHTLFGCRARESLVTLMAPGLSAETAPPADPAAGEHTPEIKQSLLAMDAELKRFDVLLAKVTETREVETAVAVQLGFDPEQLEQLDSDGLVSIPAWRHALINIAHPLLKQGLVILDTPGLNAIGTEPELTLNLIPHAHAVLFILAADTGVTRSDIEVWREHIGAGDLRSYGFPVGTQFAGGYINGTVEQTYSAGLLHVQAPWAYAMNCAGLVNFRSWRSLRLRYNS